MIAPRHQLPDFEIVDPGAPISDEAAEIVAALLLDLVEAEDKCVTNVAFPQTEESENEPS